MEDQYNKFIETVTSVEMGVNRGLLASSGKKPKKLQSFNDFKDSVQVDTEADIWWKRPKVEDET